MLISLSRRRPHHSAIMSPASAYAFYNATSTALSKAAYKNALVALFFLFYFEVGHSCVSSHD